MENYCGADCGGCPSKAGCRGCLATGGSPFGGRCSAAEHIKTGGMDAWREYKARLTDEINDLLRSEGLPEANCLFELLGAYVNLAYPTPGGEAVRLLNDRNVYLGAQLPLPDGGRCCGVVADETFILISGYGAGGSDPELILYRKR